MLLSFNSPKDNKKHWELFISKTSIGTKIIGQLKNMSNATLAWVKFQGKSRFWYPSLIYSKTASLAYNEYSSKTIVVVNTLVDWNMIYWRV